MVDELVLDDPEEIPNFITGKADVWAGEIEVWCDGVTVCRYTGGELSYVACDHPVHGCHPRYRTRYANIRAMVEKMSLLGASSVCPKCGGAGWLKPYSPEARHVVLLSLMMGMWRGVAFTPQGLSGDDLSVTVGAFLSGKPPEGASSCPAGMAAPGRALFHPAASGQGKDKSKGAGNGQ